MNIKGGYEMLLVEDKSFDLDFNEYFSVKNSFLRGAFGALPIDCDSHDYTFFFKQDIESPTIFKHKYGSRLKDIIHGGNSILLMHDAVKQVFEENQFSGWGTFPIELIGKDNERIEGYHGLKVTGKCGPPHSELKWMPTPVGELASNYVGLYFDPEQWDGSDIFSPEGTLFIIVTRRVKEALERKNLKMNTIYFQKLTYFSMTAHSSHRVTVNPGEAKKILESEFLISNQREFILFLNDLLSDPNNRLKSDIEKIEAWKEYMKNNQKKNILSLWKSKIFDNRRSH